MWTLGIPVYRANNVYTLSTWSTVLQQMILPQVTHSHAVFKYALISNVVVSYIFTGWFMTKSTKLSLNGNIKTGKAHCISSIFFWVSPTQAILSFHLPEYVVFRCKETQLDQRLCATELTALSFTRKVTLCSSVQPCHNPSHCTLVFVSLSSFFLIPLLSNSSSSSFSSFSELTHSIKENKRC